jgi:uncharacterized protein YdeI (BOF family)
VKNGDKVLVTGIVDKGFFSTNISARTVTADKTLGQTVGEAIDAVTGQNNNGAMQVATIKALPESGFIKIDGMVDSPENTKFTLKDSTGTVEVDLKTTPASSLNQGAEVTVTGYVRKGILSKSVDATEVNMRMNNAPVMK